MPVGHYKRGASLEERFWTKVDKTGDCWIFQTNTLVGGYGRLKIEGRMVLAHRHAFEIQHGPVPDGHNVFQRCRNKLCMRGDHLYTGGKNTGPKEDRPLGLPDKGAFASDDWRDIDGFPGYEVSRFGEVRSWWRRGHSMYAEKPKLLTAGPGGPGGYYYVTMVNEQGRVNRVVHRIVLEAFVGLCPPGHEGRHFPDGDVANNRLENLSWSTHQENMDDQIAHGTRATGDRHGTRLHPESRPRGDKHYTKTKPELVRHGSAHHSAKLSTEDYDEVVRLLAAGVPQSRIAAQVGISQAQISDIKTGKRRR